MISIRHPASFFFSLYCSSALFPLDMRPALCLVKENFKNSAPVSCSIVCHPYCRCSFVSTFCLILHGFLNPVLLWMQCTRTQYTKTGLWWIRSDSSIYYLPMWPSGCYLTTKGFLKEMRGLNKIMSIIFHLLSSTDPSCFCPSLFWFPLWLLV